MAWRASGATPGRRKGGGDGARGLSRRGCQASGVERRGPRGGLDRGDTGSLRKGRPGLPEGGDGDAAPVHIAHRNGGHVVGAARKEEPGGEREVRGQPVVVVDVLVDEGRVAGLHVDGQAVLLELDGGNRHVRGRPGGRVGNELHLLAGGDGGLEHVHIVDPPVLVGVHVVDPGCRVVDAGLEGGAVRRTGAQEADHGVEREVRGGDQGRGRLVEDRHVRMVITGGQEENDYRAQFQH